jgi:hypothetical protein
MTKMIEHLEFRAPAGRSIAGRSIPACSPHETQEVQKVQKVQKGRGRVLRALSALSASAGLIAPVLA